MTPKALPSEAFADLHCEVCGNRDNSSFICLYTKEKYSVAQCSTCAFIFIPPYYRRKIVYADYKSAEVTAAVRVGNSRLKIERHRLRMQFIRKYIRKGHLFDLGAGWGHFLLAARESGFEISGIEIAGQPYRYCAEELKLPVTHEDFFLMSEDQKFDCITLWDVLEHIDAADQFVAKCSRMIKSGGYLFLQVPQIDSLIAKLHKDKWKMMGLDHVNYFSRKTIRRLLEKNNFEVRAVKSSFELKLFLMYTVMPWIRKMTGKKKGTMREVNESITAAERQQYFNRITRRPEWQIRLIVLLHNLIYKTMSFLHIGEEMMVAAKKK
jgi:2-polyprenyl-3-methyl-5-hydroxy-6-metoxy-1,4-benzoquinol methylase